MFTVNAFCPDYLLTSPEAKKSRQIHRIAPRSGAFLRRIVRDPGRLKISSPLFWQTELLNAVSGMNLAELFIVSKCLITEDEEENEAAVKGNGAVNSGLNISVIEAPGAKCPRCWMHSEEADAETGLCPRCASVVAKL